MVNFDIKLWLWAPEKSRKLIPAKIFPLKVSSNIGENALCRKNGQFCHKIELLRESTSPIMLKFGLEIALGRIQKSDAAIFEILIFRDFSGGQSPNFCPNRPFLDFDPLKNRQKSKFQKSPHHFFVACPKLSQDQISALMDL